MSTTPRSRGDVRQHHESCQRTIDRSRSRRTTPSHVNRRAYGGPTPPIRSRVKWQRSHMSTTPRDEETSDNTTSRINALSIDRGADEQPQAMGIEEHMAVQPHLSESEQNDKGCEHMSIQATPRSRGDVRQHHGSYLRIYRSIAEPTNNPKPRDEQYKSICRSSPTCQKLQRCDAFYTVDDLVFHSIT
jgi:hypothetical protein